MLQTESVGIAGAGTIVGAAKLTAAAGTGSGEVKRPHGDSSASDIDELIAQLPPKMTRKQAEALALRIERSVG